MIGPVVWGSVWGHGPELARYLSGHAAVLYFNPLVPKKAAAPSFRGRDAYPVPEGIKIIERRSRFSTGILYGLQMEWKNLLAAVRSDPDCLVTYYPLGSIMALLWCRLKGKRSLFVFADFPDILGHRLARLLARNFGLWATARLATAGTVATSGLLFEDLLEISGRAILVPNGVDLEALSVSGVTGSGKPAARAADTFTAGFIGFFGDWVDMKLLFDCARLCPEIKFVLVGDGPDLDKLKTRTASQNNLEFTGLLPHNEVFQAVARMDLCLIPFKVNQVTDRVSPVKLFEYWAMGKPVLATGCRELRRIAESAPQALTFFSSAEELAGLLEIFRRDPQRIAKASAEALQAVRSYDWKLLGAEILSFLEGEAPEKLL